MKYALIISLLVNVALAYLLFDAAYLLFDAAVSLDGYLVHGEHMSERSELALKVLNDSWKGISIEDALKVSEKYEAEGEIVKRQKDQVQIGDLVFQVSEDSTIKEIHFLGD